MFKTMKYINKIEPKVPQLNIKHKNRYTANEKKQAQIIANHFKKQFEKEKKTKSLSTTNTNENTIFKRRNIRSYESTQKQGKFWKEMI